MYEWYQEKYVGAAHGLAGIYYFLMQVRKNRIEAKSKTNPRQRECFNFLSSVVSAAWPGGLRGARAPAGQAQRGLCLPPAISTRQLPALCGRRARPAGALVPRSAGRGLHAAAGLQGESLDLLQVPATQGPQH